jgi:hypothetical protein
MAAPSQPWIASQAAASSAHSPPGIPTHWKHCPHDISSHMGSPESDSDSVSDSESVVGSEVVELELGSVVDVTGSTVVDAVVVTVSVIDVASLVLVEPSGSGSLVLLLPLSGSTHSPASHSSPWAQSEPSHVHWSVPGMQPEGMHAEISATHSSPASHVPLP